MQLNPLETFTVVRQIEDHLDSNTYYVRAVIRNARTDAIIATLNLTDQGSQRFSKNWQVSADVSGQGYYISVTTSVYTDSGYTTKSENYGDREQTYLVQARMNNVLGGSGGGGGPDIDYQKIRKILDELLKIRLGLEKDQVSLEMPAIPTVITTTKEVIAPIEFPEMPQPTDIKPLKALCEQILEVLNRPAEKEETREAEIIQNIQKLDKEVRSLPEKVTSVVSQSIEDQTTILAEKIESELANIGGMLEETPVVRFPDIKATPREKEKPVDRRINRLLTKI